MKTAFTVFLAMVATVAAAPCALAQNPQSLIVVSPAQPAAYQPFQITFPATSGSPTLPVSVRLDAGVLKLNYVATETDFIPPSPEVTVTVAGLAEGTYPVRLVHWNRLELSEYDTGEEITVTPAPATVPVYALYNVITHHFFITAGADEYGQISTNGNKSGWAVSDPGFSAWPAAGPAPDAAHPVCRFYSPIVNSHFYTADAAECDGLKQTGSGWTYEGIAFRALLPKGMSCSGGTVPVWRLFNNRAAQQDSNHRFVASSDTYQSMINDGWIGEGVAFCSPN